MPLRHLLGGQAALAPLVLLGALAVAGCDEATPGGESEGHAHGHEHDHDHGHRPDSLHEAVEQLTEIGREISSAIESGDTDAAHEPLHEVAELLEAVPDIAAETELSEEQWKAVKAASDRLFDAYAVIDKAYHVKDSDKQAAYEQVADDLTEALEEIRTLLPMTGEEGPTSEHDGHHDHQEHGHEHGAEEHDAEEQAAQESGAGS